MIYAQLIRDNSTAFPVDRECSLQMVIVSSYAHLQPSLIYNQEFVKNAILTAALASDTLKISACLVVILLLFSIVGSAMFNVLKAVFHTLVSVFKTNSALLKMDVGYARLLDFVINASLTMLENLLANTIVRYLLPS